MQVVDAVKERLADIAPLVPAGYEHPRRPRPVGVHQGLDAGASRSTSSSARSSRPLVVLVFLWNWRSTIIAAIAIPTSIIATFGLIWYQGFTLNSMTMLALTLAVGIVIDDAIVVLENIYRFVEEKGRPPMQAAVEATREIGLAVLATTLSLVAIFVPVGFMGGIVGRFMTSFGLHDVVRDPGVDAGQLHADADAVGALDQDAPAARGRRGTRDRGARVQGVALLPSGRSRSTPRRCQWSLAHRGIVAGIAVLVLLSSVPLFMVANKNFMPNDDQSEFEVGLRAPEGTSLEATEIIANRIATRDPAAARRSRSRW